MTSHTLTINRAHKVVERLKTLLKQHENRSIETGSAIDTGLPVGEGVIARMGERSNDFETALANYQAASAALVSVRQVIGKANAANGINDLLAEQDGLSKELKLFKVVLERCGGSTAVAPGELKDYPIPQAQAASTGGYLRGQSAGIKVYSLDKARQQQLEQQAKALQSKLHGIADRIAEANRASVTFELPTEISEAVGL